MSIDELRDAHYRACDNADIARQEYLACETDERPKLRERWEKLAYVSISQHQRYVDAIESNMR